MARIFCTPPDHYRVVPGDNAHQETGFLKWEADPRRNRERLLRAWHGAADEMTRLGHELLVPELVKDAPDQVFAADSVLHFRNAAGQHEALLSNMNSPDRQREVDAAERLFRSYGYRVHANGVHHKREGTGDCLYAHDLGFYFMGYGPRTDLGAGQKFADVTGKTVFAVPLMASAIPDALTEPAGGLRSRDVYGFHLDVMAQPLPSGHLICRYPALPTPAQDFFSTFYAHVFDEKRKSFQSRFINVGASDYDRFATNAVAVPDGSAPNGYTLFVPDDISEALQDRLSRIGYRLFPVDIEVARWSGGGLHCMFNVENDFSATAPRRLNAYHEYLIQSWTNPPDVDDPAHLQRPGIRAFHPRVETPANA